MFLLSVIHSDVQVRDGPVTVLRDVERNVECDDVCHVVRNVLRNTIRSIRKRRLTRKNMEPFILTVRARHPGALA